MKVAKFRRNLGLIIRLFFNKENKKKKFQNRKKHSQCTVFVMTLAYLCDLLLFYDEDKFLM
jgi:hypothetical protein